jgi:hypothetical protein
MEKNENDVVAIVLVTLIVVVVPFATITSQNFYLLKIIFNLTF